LQTVSLIQAQPALARFEFRFTNRWLSGPRTRSTVRSFFGAGQTQQHVTPIDLSTDEPPVLLGSDLNANPGEYLMHALAACVTSAIVYHAAARGIAIQKIESTIEGDVDLRGFLGLDASVRTGFEQIRMKLKIKANVHPARVGVSARRAGATVACFGGQLVVRAISCRHRESEVATRVDSCNVLVSV
jgi:uncharacterized OsmC-like protein